MMTMMQFEPDSTLWDYNQEAFGSSALDLEFEAHCDHWDDERECDIRDIPTVCEARYDYHVKHCMEILFWAIWTAQQGSDYIPF